MINLAQSILRGERLATARLLTHIENDTPQGREALDILFAHTGKAHLIGITGSPGTGKSSLVNQIALQFRKLEKKIAIVAIDPTSPFTGGAVLGDRVRMRDLAGDPGVFIRSMASRGSLGGLAQATSGVVQVFDAAGFDIILIETVGAGQSEVDIARLAHTTLVVEAPGFGDDIQAIKAGILEIADILVINKADHPGVEGTEKALKSMLDLAHPVQKIFQHHGQAITIPEDSRSPQDDDQKTWIPPICKTIAINGSGVSELVEAIQRHEQFLRKTGEWHIREKARLYSEFENYLQQALMERFRASVSDTTIEQTLASIHTRKLSMREAVNILLR